MDRMRRVGQVWNWLPAFRAVAETEHLPTAASGLHVTPPALSRTLKLLQEDLGVALFERQGRNLKLNAAGQRLLLSVRRAMRGVHAALADLEGDNDRVVRVCSLGMFTRTYLEPTVTGLLRAWPHVRPQVRTSGPTDAASDLLLGHLDVLFTSAPFFREGLQTQVLGRVQNGVYCGQGHPLRHAKRVTLADLERHPFVAPPPDGFGRTPEGWPPEWRRRVAVTADRQSVGFELCAAGRLLAVLPAPMAQLDPHLVRLPVELPTSMPMVAVTREPHGEPGPVDYIVQMAAEAVSAG